jgi:hypothetical protein
MTKLNAAVLAVALAFVATACGGSSDSSSSGNSTQSCTRGSGASLECWEFSSNYPGGFTAGCNASGGSAQSGACTSTNRVGRCTTTFTAGTISYSVTEAYYSAASAPTPAECAAIAGSSGGVTFSSVWTPN